MKKLNELASTTLNKMISMMVDGYIKIDNSGGSFLPVSVEIIFENHKYLIVSVAHYYEQNSDLLCDPEMCFILIKADGAYLPSYFKQDNIGMEQESILIEDGKIKGYRLKLQSDHTLFANRWLHNIKQQQNL